MMKDKNKQPKSEWPSSMKIRDNCVDLERGSRAGTGGPVQITSSIT